MDITQLRESVERHFAAGPAVIGDSSALDTFLELRAALERGEIRAASPDSAAPNLPMYTQHNNNFVVTWKSIWNSILCRNFPECSFSKR